MSKAIVFLADGFEECEGLIVVDILRRAGIETIMASIMDRLEVKSSRNIKVQADLCAEVIDYSTADLIVLPGGRQGIKNLAKSEIVVQQCKIFAKEKYIAAICAGPSILARLGLLNGKRATCHPDFENDMIGAELTGESVTSDDNIITAKGLGATFEFAFELVKTLVGEVEVEQIKQAICYEDETC